MKKTLIWGIGRDFDMFMKRIKNMQEVFRLDMFEYVDSNSQLWGKSLSNGIKIQSPDSLDGIEDYICVVSTGKYYEDIKSLLNNKYNVPQDCICTLDEYFKRSIIEYQYNEFRNKRAISNPRDVSNKMVVYTTIINSYDTLKEPLYVDENVDYICFTDQDGLKSDVWKITQVERNRQISAKMQVEYYKLLPHIYFENYETSIWVDASLKIKDSVIEFVGRYNTASEILLFPHPERICIYDEAAVCMLDGRENKELILQQMTKYYSEGYKANSGLFCGGVLVRKHNDPQIIRAMELWYREVQSYSARDQISLPVVLHKTKQDIDLCNLNIFDNQFFVFSDHIRIQ